GAAAPYRHGTARRPVPPPAWALGVPCAGRERVQGVFAAGLRAAEPAAGPGAATRDAGAGRPHGGRLRARGGQGERLMRVQLLRAWPNRCETVDVEVDAGARVGDALDMAGWRLDGEFVGLAVFGISASPDATLHPGDRIELLRPLQ